MDSESEYEPPVWENFVPNLPSPMQDESEADADAINSSQEVTERGSFKGTLYRTEFAGRLHKIETMVNHLWVQFLNSKIQHLSQRLVPRESQMGPYHAAIFFSFPKTALDFYLLQVPEHWPKLKELLLCYKLEDQLIYPNGDQHKGAGYGTQQPQDVTYSYTQVQSAIMANPFGALKVLGAHLGVDAEAVRQLALQANLQPEEAPPQAANISRLVHQMSAYNRLTETKSLLRKIARVDWVCHPDRFHELIGTLGQVHGQHTDHLARDSPSVVEDSDGSL